MTNYTSLKDCKISLDTLHSQSFPMRCFECGRVRKNGKQLLFHLETHHNIKKNVKSCRRQISVTGNPTERTAFRCYICSKSRSTYDSIICHVVSRHFSDVVEQCYVVNSPKRNFLCLLCSALIKCKTHLIRHLAKKHEFFQSRLPRKEFLQFYIKPKARVNSTTSMSCRYCRRELKGKGAFVLHSVSCNKKRQADAQNRQKEEVEIDDLFDQSPYYSQLRTDVSSQFGIVPDLSRDLDWIWELPPEQPSCSSHLANDDHISFECDSHEASYEPLKAAKLMGADDDYSPLIGDCVLADTSLNSDTDGDIPIYQEVESSQSLLDIESLSG